MRVVVLGGYGVFGAKLVELLTRDAHDVIVAGRSADKAQVLAARFSAGHLALDRSGDLGPLWDAAPDVVVDAAGPFHAYGDDPYALAKACIENGAHYLDLADEPAFCAGISQLDGDARAAGLCVLSGVSSVPAISSAAVASLINGTDQVDTISTAILPGNRAPRGRSVVASILNQCGRPFSVMTDGRNVPARSWSQPEVFDLGAGIRRRGWLIEVPDNRLFADAFNARTVMFRAGLELPVMNYALALLSWLRGKRAFAIPDWCITLVLRLADMLEPLGRNTGGMVVAVTVRRGDRWQRRIWRLIVTDGDGPFIPGVAIRAVLRAPNKLKPGARPAVAVIGLDAVAAAMSDLAVQTETKTITEEPPLFFQHLGGDLTQLPDVVQYLHNLRGPRIWTGRAKVTGGTALSGRVIAALFGFPAAANDVPVTVHMTPDDDGETWQRHFGNKTFRSYMRRIGGRMTERFGPFRFVLDLHVSDGALHFPVIAGALGPLPLPRILLPQSIAREYCDDRGRFCFDVALRAPITGALIVHYQGWLQPQP